MRAGDLDRVVQLQHRSCGTQNANGESVATVTPYARVPAKRVDLTGTKRFLAQQTISQQLVEFTIRFRTDLKASDLLIDEDSGLSFEIMQSAQIGRREGLSLLCRAVVP